MMMMRNRFPKKGIKIKPQKVSKLHKHLFGGVVVTDSVCVCVCMCTV